MQTAIIVLLVVAIGVVLFVWLSMQKQNEALRQQVNTQLGEMNKQFLTVSTQTQNEALREQVNTQLSNINKQLVTTTGQIGERLEGATQMIGNVHKGLGELGEASKQIFEIGKDIASLEDILKPPKLRGVLGEVFLKELLLQLVPTNCEFQYHFKSGEIVDAIIRIGERIVPVDAKFPLDNFRKMFEVEDEKEKIQCRRAFITDIKKHIDSIASKYILPDEGTYDFALMYIPSENVYYETITKEKQTDTSISDYATRKGVIPVSPNTIYAYLQVIIFGLKGLQVEKHAEAIMQHLARLQGDFSKFTGDFELVGKHLGSAAKKYEEAEKRLDRFSDKLSLSESIAPKKIEAKPTDE